jgi:hypothetical protein
MATSVSIFQVLLGGLAASVCLSTCVKKEDSNHSPDGSKAKGLRDIFTKIPKQSLTLRTGQEIDLKTFKLTQEDNQKFESILKRHLFWRSFDISKNNDGILLSSELFALKIYSEHNYKLFSAYFDGSLYRNLKGLETEIDKERVDILETGLIATVSAINKLPKARTKVHFGACMKRTYIDSLWRNRELFTNLNFTSTSVSREIAMGYSYCPQTAGQNEENAGYLFTLENSTLGASISKYSSYDDEAEILYLPKSSFKLKSISRIPEDKRLSSDHALFEVGLEETVGK